MNMTLIIELDGVLARWFDSARIHAAIVRPIITSLA